MKKTGDISKFLFCEDCFDVSKEPLIFKFAWVLFGLNCNPFLLTATIKCYLKKFEIVYLAKVKFLNENVYVDDIIGSHCSLEDALSIILHSIEIFKNVSIQLHK